jgi:hypothetical protein
MKIKIDKDSLDFNDLKYYLVNEFPRVRFWELAENKLLAEKNKLTACYITAKSRYISVIGGFANRNMNILYFVFTIIGGIVIPLGLYYLMFYKKHKLFEQQIGESIARKFSKFHLINKTVDDK